MSFTKCAEAKHRHIVTRSLAPPLQPPPLTPPWYVPRSSVRCGWTGCEGCGRGWGWGWVTGISPLSGCAWSHRNYHCILDFSHMSTNRDVVMSQHGNGKTWRQQHRILWKSYGTKFHNHSGNLFISFNTCIIDTFSRSIRLTAAFFAHFSTNSFHSNGDAFKYHCGWNVYILKLERNWLLLFSQRKKEFSEVKFS